MMDTFKRSVLVEGELKIADCMIRHEFPEFPTESGDYLVCHELCGDILTETAKYDAEHGFQYGIGDVLCWWKLPKSGYEEDEE